MSGAERALDSPAELLVNQILDELNNRYGPVTEGETSLYNEMLIFALAFESEIRRDCIVALGEGIDTLEQAVDDVDDLEAPQPQGGAPDSALRVGLNDDGKLVVDINKPPTLPRKGD